ncbi:hypothetical protein [Alicyclobacillus fodiniaquatilis]|uniref:Uncharacterized protein n=1 Tax=Alicyclobacillus fodiniaquatilis TaxID=1661150 RepID=A0ABW4JRV1_9BACL
MSKGIRLWVIHVIAPGLAIIFYLLLTQVCWHSMGYNSAFCLIMWSFMYWVFPYWFSSLSSSVQSNKLKRMGTYCVYAVVIIGIVYFGSWIGVHASGYFDKYMKDPRIAGSGETRAIVPLVRLLQCVLAVVIYSVYYVRKRAKSEFIRFIPQ